MHAGDICRSCWRRLKASAADGDAVSASVCRALRGLVAKLKYRMPVTDLESLAIWLMYHPEAGTLPCDGWKLRLPPKFSAEELASLKARLAADRRAVEQRLKVEDVDDADLPDGGELKPRKIAVHVHCFYPDVMPRIERALRNIPCPYDLFVSSLIGADACPNRGRDIAPLICRYGKTLSEYDYVAHFHTKKSAHAQEEGDWLEHILSALLGSAARVRGIFALLENGYGMVCATDSLKMREDPTGWLYNLPTAEALLKRLGMEYDLRHDFTPIVFPQGSMFWARGDFVRGLLTLPLTFEDFPEEPIGLDGTLAHALERLLFVLGLESGMKVAKIGEATHD